MTSVELNQELFRQLSVIAGNEEMMRQAVKALNRIVKRKEQDTALMSRKDFVARLEQAERGTSQSFANVEELDKYVRSL